MTPASTDDVESGDPPRPLTRWLLALGILVAAWSALGIPAHATYGARVTADEPQYLLSAISLADDGDLDIADELEREAYRPFHAVDLPRQTYELADGQHLSPHDPLLPVILAVPVRLGGWAAAKATIAIIAGMLAALTAWTAVRRFGVEARTALPVVAVFACSAPLATYATQIYPELPAALVVMGAVAAMTGPLRWRGLAVVIVAVTALPWLSIKYAPVAGALMLLTMWRLRDRRSASLATVGAIALSGVVYLVVHRSIYGGWTAYATGDHFSETGELSVVGSSPHYVGRSRRLVGLLVDDTFGIAVWTIGWLALPFSVGVLLARRRPGWTVLLLPLAVGWLTATFVALTMHGWWWPGRQLVVVLPLGVIVIAAAADGIAHLRGALLLAGALGMATWLWTTVEAVSKSRTLVVDFDRTSNLAVRIWRLALPDGRTPTTADAALSVGWTLVVIALICLGASHTLRAQVSKA